MSKNWNAPWGPSEKYAYREGILKGRKQMADEIARDLDRANFREAATMLATGEVPLHSPTKMEEEVKNLRERVELLEAWKRQVDEGFQSPFWAGHPLHKRIEPVTVKVIPEKREPIDVIRAEFRKINKRHGIEGDQLGGFIFNDLKAAGLIKDWLLRAATAFTGTSR